MLPTKLICDIQNQLNINVHNVSELGRGACNVVFKLETDCGALCLKQILMSSTKPELNTLYVEAQLIQKLKIIMPELRIPCVRMIDSSGEYYVYDYVDGVQLMHFEFDTLTAQKTFTQLGQFFAQLHSIEQGTLAPIQIAEHCTLYENKYVPRSRMSAVDETLPQQFRTVLLWALNYLDQRNYEPKVVLLHNDAHNENIFVHSDGQLNCVIDFGDALWGDPHLDFINLVHEFPQYWHSVIDSYEQSTQTVLDRKRIVALAIVRFSKQLIKMWNENTDRAHVQSKFDDYQGLIILHG